MWLFVNENINFKTRDAFSKSFKDESCEFDAYWIEYDCIRCDLQSPLQEPDKIS